MVALMNLGHPRLLVVILVVTAVVDTCRDGVVVVLAMVAMMRLEMPMVLFVMAAMVTAVMAAMVAPVMAAMVTAVMAGMVTAMVTLVVATMMAAMMTLVMAAMMTLVMGSMMTMVFAMVFAFVVLGMVSMVLVVRFGIETNTSHVVHTVCLGLVLAQMQANRVRRDMTSVVALDSLMLTERQVWLHFEAVAGRCEQDGSGVGQVRVMMQVP
jgi:hypothetical protein